MMFSFNQCLYSLNQPTILNMPGGVFLNAIYIQKWLYFSVLSVNEIVLHKMVTVINQYITYKEF